MDRTLIKKIAEKIEMSFDIPPAEQKEAETIIDLSKKFLAVLSNFGDYLKIIYKPFSSAQEVSSKAVYDNRAAFGNYQQEIIKKFDILKSWARKVVYQLEVFNSDTTINEIINSFRDGFDEFKADVQQLLSLFDNENLRSPDFKNKVVEAVEGIIGKEEGTGKINELKELVNDRIIAHVESNILPASDWNDAELEKTVEKHLPYLTRLYLERQKALSQGNK